MKNMEAYLESQLSERLQSLLHNTRVEIMKAGFGVEAGSTFEVAIMDGSTKVAGFSTAAQEDRTWKWPGHVWADLAGGLRGREHANLELRVFAPIMRREGVVLDLAAMNAPARESERAPA